jgi:hypothetical protein
MAVRATLTTPVEIPSVQNLPEFAAEGVSQTRGLYLVKVIPEV